MNGQISLVVPVDTLHDAQNSQNNKRKHEDCVPLLPLDYSTGCASMPLMDGLAETTRSLDAKDAACSKAPRIRQAMTATASLILDLTDANDDDDNDDIDLDSPPFTSSSSDICSENTTARTLSSACSALSLDLITPPAAWNDLPDDVLRRILDHLPSHSLRVVRSVCKGWWQSTNRSIKFARPERLSGAHLQSSFPNLRVLDLSCCDAALEMTSPLELSLRSGLYDASLGELAGLQHLNELILRGCIQFTGAGLQHLHALPMLEHVDLTGCTGLTDAGIAAGLSGLHHVSAITLLNCSGLSDASVAALATLPNLHRIAVPPKTTNEGLRILAAVSGVQRVAIRGCSQVDPSGIAALLQASNLRRVVVSRCPRVTAVTLGDVAPNLSVVSCAVAGGGGGVNGGVQTAAVVENLHNNNNNNNNGNQEYQVPGAGGAAALPPPSHQMMMMMMGGTGGGNGSSFNSSTHGLFHGVNGIGIPALDPSQTLPAMAAPDLQLLMATFHN